MKRFCIIFATLSLAACSTTKDFTIITDPVGASVSINGKKIEGVATPATVEIDQTKNLAITVEKPGYQLDSEIIKTTTNWWRDLIWTEYSPYSRYIEEDEITISLKKIASPAAFKPTPLPPFNPPSSKSSSKGTDASSLIPGLRPMPKF